MMNTWSLLCIRMSQNIEAFYWVNLLLLVTHTSYVLNTVVEGIVLVSFCTSS